MKVASVLGTGLSKIAKAFRDNPDKAIAAATLTSITVKDGIGCAMYVTQSLNNKKIPDERRKFVAALDLTNGILMIVSQIILFKAMHKFNKPIFEKIFQKTFGNGKNNSFERSARALLRAEQRSAGKPIITKPDFGTDFKKVKADLFSTFGLFSELVASTILAKRVIVPFISTPLADVVKKHWDKQDTANVESTDNKKQDYEGKNKKLDVMSTSDVDTNLLNRYRKYYLENQIGQIITGDVNYDIYSKKRK